MPQNVNNKSEDGRNMIDSSFIHWMSKFHIANNGCIEWVGKITSEGYGAINGSERTAHRFAAIAMVGNADGRCVMHKCDNRLCCNPVHLVFGTKKDNMLDMAAKGRGSKTGARRKLSDDDVVDILEMAERGITFGGIAKAFGISRIHAMRIARREDRKDVLWFGSIRPKRPSFRKRAPCFQM